MHLLRKAALIVAAMIGSAIIMSIIIVLALSLTPYGIRPSEMVPYDDTDAFMLGTNPALLPVWQAITKDTKTTADHDAVAWVVPKNDAKGTVTFDRKTEGVDYDSVVGSFGIRFSDAALKNHIHTSQASLSSDVRFRLFSSRLRRDASWLYVKTKAIPAPETLMDTALFGSLIGKTAEAVGIAHDENRWKTHIYDTQTSTLRWNAPSTVPYMEHPLIILSTANAAAALEDTVSALPPDTAAILEGLIAKHMSDRFGPGISIRYDFVPLLVRPTSIQLSSSGSSVHFLMAGSMDIGSDLTKKLTRLHDIFNETLPTSHIVRRTLDPRFPSSDVRDDPTLAEQTEEEINGWTLRSTMSPEYDRALVTAMRGSEYMMGNNVADMRKAITMPSNTLNVPMTKMQGSTFVAGGQANMNAVEQILKSILPAAKFTKLPLHDTVRWSIERSGRLRIIMLQTMTDSVIPK